MYITGNIYCSQNSLYMQKLNNKMYILNRKTRWIEGADYTQNEHWHFQQHRQTRIWSQEEEKERQKGMTTCSIIQSSDVDSVLRLLSEVSWQRSNSQGSLCLAFVCPYVHRGENMLKCLEGQQILDTYIETMNPPSKLQILKTFSKKINTKKNKAIQSNATWTVDILNKCS